MPAVLAMRDSIADDEALSFIQAFAQALAQQQPVDRAVAIALWSGVPPSTINVCGRPKQSAPLSANAEATAWK